MCSVGVVVRSLNYLRETFVLLKCSLTRVKLRAFSKLCDALPKQAVKVRVSAFGSRVCIVHTVPQAAGSFLDACNMDDKLCLLQLYVPRGVDISLIGTGLNLLISRRSSNSCQTVTALGHSKLGPHLNQ